LLSHFQSHQTIEQRFESIKSNRNILSNI